MSKDAEHKTITTASNKVILLCLDVCVCFFQDSYRFKHEASIKCQRSTVTGGLKWMFDINSIVHCSRLFLFEHIYFFNYMYISAGKLPVLEDSVVGPQQSSISVTDFKSYLPNDGVDLTRKELSALDATKTGGLLLTDIVTLAARQAEMIGSGRTTGNLVEKGNATVTSVEDMDSKDSGLDYQGTFKSETQESLELYPQPETMSVEESNGSINDSSLNSDMYKTVKVEYVDDYDADTDVEDYSYTTMTPKKKKPKTKYKKKSKKQKGERDTEKVFCSDCNKTYSSRKNYEIHLQKNNGKCYFECEYCSKVFYYKKSKLDVHIRSAHTKERPYVCEVCGKGYVTPDKLRIHVRVHTGEKPCVCDQCGKAFYSLGQLSIHKNYHHIWKQEPHMFKCEECHSGFSSKNYLKYHMKVIHCKTRDYLCTKCPKRFKSTDGLKYHLKFTHAERSAYKCDKCDKTFKAPAGLRRHKMTHLSIIPKRFVCTVCEKAFIEKEKLKMHMNVHTGEKPYKCNMCDFRCAFSGNLSKHKRTHTGNVKDMVAMVHVNDTPDTNVQSLNGE